MSRAASIEPELAESAAAGSIAGGEPAAFALPRWYATSTRANHERRVAEHLLARGIEHFLPQYQAVRQWKDRKVRLELPLLPGYVLVHLALRDRRQALEVPGVAGLVAFGGHPAALGEEEVARLREVVSAGMGAAPHVFVRVGRRARVKSGPLCGLEGIVVQVRGRQRLVLSVELLMRSIAVDVDLADLELLAA